MQLIPQCRKCNKCGISPTRPRWSFGGALLVREINGEERSRKTLCARADVSGQPIRPAVSLLLEEKARVADGMLQSVAERADLTFSPRGVGSFLSLALVSNALRRV